MRYSESMNVKLEISVSFLLLAVSVLAQPNLAAASWDFSKASIPVNEIMSGGPPRDGIPALTEPKFMTVTEATMLRDDEQVLGVFINGVAKAYPTRILSWHELVNDYYRDLPVLVSW